MRRALALLLLTAACQSGGGDLPETGPRDMSLAAQVVRQAEQAPPPVSGADCWASEVSPAVIETVTEQVMLRPEQRDAAGVVTRKAEYRSEVHQEIVSPRGKLWFPTPCPHELTADFVLTLQRALAARGYYLGSGSGALDAQTRRAIARYQAERGLKSATLSIGAAQQLGLLSALPQE